MELKNRINIFISSLSLVEKIIVLNIVLYIIPFILNTFLFLFNIKNLDILSWFTIDADLSKLIFKPWSFITYGFLHGSFSHIFWNMIILYYFGKILNNLFGDKLFKNLYLSVDCYFICYFMMKFFWNREVVFFYDLKRRVRAKDFS